MIRAALEFVALAAFFAMVLGYFVAFAPAFGG